MDRYHSAVGDQQNINTQEIGFLNTRRFALTGIIIVLALLSVGMLDGETKAYTVVSIRKVQAGWLDRLKIGLKKAGTDFVVNVSQMAPMATSVTQKVRLIEDAINQGTNAILAMPLDVKSIELTFALAPVRLLCQLIPEGRL
jgi:ABC-type sugar transport system substrate-binding protein